MTSLVSIITATYNSENTVRDTHASIVAQTHENWEWLVTDDCSDDSTPEILAALAAEDGRIKVQKNETNQGAAASRNCSLRRAQGKFIAFIDSDDMWYPQKLEKQIEFMGHAIDFSFTAYELVDQRGDPLGRYVDTRPTTGVSYRNHLRKKATIGCSTVMLRRSAFEDISMPNIRTGQDYATWLKLLKTGVPAYGCGQVLTKYRLSPGSISSNKYRKALRQWEIYRRHERLGIVDASICFVFYAYRAVFRR